MDKSITDNQLSLDEEILQSYSPDLLDDIFRVYLKPFLSETNKYFEIWNLDKREFDGLTIRKREIARLFSITLEDEEIFHSWFKTLPYMVHKVFETIVWEGDKLILDLNARTKGDILLTDDVQYLNRDSIQSEYCLFLLDIKKHEDFEGNPVIRLSLPWAVRKSCRRFLPKPKGYYLKALKSIEATKYQFCDKGKILDAVPVLNEFIAQGHLEVTRNGMLSKLALARLSKQCDLHEFFPDHPDSSAKFMRVELMAFLIHSFNQNLEQAAPIDFLKAIIHRFENLPEPLLVRFLDHVKGWYQASSYFQADYNHDYVRLIKQLPEDRWVSLKQLNRFIEVRDFRLYVVREEACHSLHFPGNWEGWGNKKHSLQPRHLQDCIVNPYLQINLFVFAALGLIDIRFDPAREGVHLPDQIRFYTLFDGIKYIRLTPLGAYALGITKAYEQLGSHEIATELLLDENRLLVSISKPDARMEMILGQIGERIGRLRFKVDYQSTLKDCDSEDELAAKIKRFLTLVTNEIPGNWQQFIADVQQKGNSLKQDDDMIIIRIEPTNRQLVDLFTSDDELRKIVLLAEDYRILIRKRDITQFQQRMQIFGYLF